MTPQLSHLDIPFDDYKWMQACQKNGSGSVISQMLDGITNTDQKKTIIRDGMYAAIMQNKEDNFECLLTHAKGHDVDLPWVLVIAAQMELPRIIDKLLPLIDVQDLNIYLEDEEVDQDVKDVLVAIVSNHTKDVLTKEVAGNTADKLTPKSKM